jgi:taurine dioxygenase
MFEVRSLPIGVEIEADLRQPLSPAEADELVRLYRRHHLVLFRGQDELTPADHERVGAYLGPVPPSAPGDPAVHMISTGGSLGSGELVFHADLSFDPDPYQAVSLLALDIDPPDTTSTTFADAVAAYTRLPSSLRERIDGRTSRHVFPIDTSARSVYEERPTEFPSCDQPIVMSHPETGEPLLFVTYQASTAVSGLSEAESEELLAQLFEVLYDPVYLYDHKWRTGDLIFWDNRAVQHARGDQSEMRARTLQRLVLSRESVNQRYHDFFASSAAYLERVDRRR